MDFDDIIKRESKTDELKKRFNKLQLEFDVLESNYYSETKINDLKDKMKQKLLDEFKEYFKSKGFSVKSSYEENNFVGNLENRTASIGNYKIIFSISISFRIFLEVQHKNDFKKEEYTLSMDLSSESAFHSCIDNEYHNITDMIKLLESDISSLQKISEENKPLEVVCKFDDGLNMDMDKEYKSFKDIIEDIPNK
ncbi:MULTISPECIES: hypothetical protein [Clostridium]|uniref:hypothetical protein n=1 Tax=Clostridium TaxID=1485 RepID=UPI00082547E0|nr:MULTISPECIES: hypothetical protein [Clostridium]PJI07651.1 hypothetical protein CUB90_07145 [Clostridium sp. CT7]